MSNLLSGRKILGGPLTPVVLVTPNGEPLSVVEVRQLVHDRLNLNANIQVNNSDVGLLNPVPVISRNQVLRIEQTPTITAGAYTIADAVGGMLTFPDAALANGRGGTITKVLITDLAGQNVAYDLHLFRRAFTPTADNAAWNPSNADMAYWEGFIDVAATDRSTGTNNSGAVKSTGLRCPFPYICDATSLFGQLVVRGAAPTYTSTADLTVKIYTERW